MAEAGLARLEGLDDVLWSAPLVALGLRAVADLGEAASVQRGGAIASDTETSVARLRGDLDLLAPKATTAGGRGWIALGRGELARLDGEPGTDAWAAAIEAFDAVPQPLTAAYARLRAAEAALRSHGLRADVGMLLGDAMTAADLAGARPLVDALAELAARARIQLAPTGTAASAPSAEVVIEVATAAPDPRAAAIALGLSAREVEVLELVVAGMSNGEIADRLFITRKTAAVHVTHILDKLGVSNRVGAAMIGARVGLGAPPADGDYLGTE
jgi:DNA-binding CsgD family transcriptional regulator